MRTLLFCCFLAVPLFVSAQSDFDPLGTSLTDRVLGGERQIRIQAEWIEVSHEKLTELMAVDRRVQPEGRLSTNNQPLRDEITELVKKGEAKIVETMMVIARSGNRAKAESMFEFIYPTEYEPTTRVTTKKIPSDKDEKTITETTEEPTAGPPLATAFDIRNLGSVLEVDPILGADDRTIDLNLAPELVYQTGFENYGTYDQDGLKTEIKMPRIFAAKVTTQVTMIDGQYLMAAVVSPRNIQTGEPDMTRKLMLFLKSDILVCGIPIEKKK